MWGTGKPGRWSELDLTLLKALTMYESGLCSGCGNPLGHTTTDEAAMNTFPVESVQCWACSGLEEHRKDDPKSGEKSYTVNRMTELWR